MTTIAMYGAGHMGSGLGWALRPACRVITTLAGRSARTARLAADAGLDVVPDVDTLVGTAEIVLVVTPPAAARDAARVLAQAAVRTGATPLVADLNAIAPDTARDIAVILAPLDFVDGSISGPPPTVRPGARIYLSGPRATEITALPWSHVTPVDLGPVIGTASAVKMCTASVYKGLIGLYAQAMRAADYYGVLAPVLADLQGNGYDLVSGVAISARKAARYTPEMREISAAQNAAGLPATLFAAFADVYDELAGTALALGDPESTDIPSATDIVARMRRSTGG